MSIREKDCYILTSLKIRSASHTHICQATKYHLSLILMASRALYNFNWPLRWRSARDYFTILARCRPATPRVSILKPPEKLEAVNPSPGCLSQAVKPRVSDNWPLIGQYLPLIGRCPVTSPWPARVTEIMCRHIGGSQCLKASDYYHPTSADTAPLATIIATNICKVRGLKSAWRSAHPLWQATQRSNWNVERGYGVWSCLEVGFLIPPFLPL